MYDLIVWTCPVSADVLRTWRTYQRTLAAERKDGRLASRRLALDIEVQDYVRTAMQRGRATSDVTAAWRAWMLNDWQYITDSLVGTMEMVNGIYRLRAFAARRR